MNTRYSQCDSTCTVDCGHCKGEGPPPPHAEVVETRLATHYDSWSVSNLINDAVGNSRTVLFNGEVVTTQYGRRPAVVWDNGTLSVDVVGRIARVGTRWAKQGRTVRVEVQ